MSGKRGKDEWKVIDLFSGAGGMSYGFHAHKRFRIIGAADAQNAKPSSGPGTLECNSTYAANMGVEPECVDLASISPKKLRDRFPGLGADESPAVLISCAPCTGFTRAQAKNHLQDDKRNSLVGRSLLYVKEFRPRVFVMENARELLRGNFTHHAERLITGLERLGYDVVSGIHFLDRFGLPQRRERAIVIAAEPGLQAKSLEDLWAGKAIAAGQTTVRAAIGEYPGVDAGQRHAEDELHVSPRLNPGTLERLKATPADGGSWADLVDHPDRDNLLIPSMLRSVERGTFGNHPDVYGRLWWDRPSVTIKRECGHVGNGRYSHPEQDRLCTVRELSVLQGFPADYKFVASAMSNLYRHIGDAVPPLISYQIAWLCDWILTGRKPRLSRCLLPGTHLDADAIESVEHQTNLLDGLNGGSAGERSKKRGRGKRLSTSC